MFSFIPLLLTGNGLENRVVKFLGFGVTGIEIHGTLYWAESAL